MQWASSVERNPRSERQILLAACQQQSTAAAKQMAYLYPTYRRGREGQRAKESRDGIRLTHVHLRILSEHLRLLAGIEVSLRMSTRTSRSACWSTSGHHTCHHRSCLAHLRSSWPGDSGMHLRPHGNPWLLSPARNPLGGRMSLRHGMTAVDSHARCVLPKRLRHAHHGQCSRGVSSIS